MMNATRGNCVPNMPEPRPLWDGRIYKAQRTLLGSNYVRYFPRSVPLSLSHPPKETHLSLQRRIKFRQAQSHDRWVTRPGLDPGVPDSRPPYWLVDELTMTFQTSHNGAYYHHFPYEVQMLVLKHSSSSLRQEGCPERVWLAVLLAQVIPKGRIRPWVSSSSFQTEQQNGNLVASALEEVMPLSSLPGLSLLWLHLTVFNLQLHLGFRALGQSRLIDLS